VESGKEKVESGERKGESGEVDAGEDLLVCAMLGS